MISFFNQDDKSQLKYVSKTSDVYAVEVISVVNPTSATDNRGADDVAMVTASTWHSCNICFDEKFEEELLVHRKCNGVLCPGCLGDTLKHSKNDHGDFPCPVGSFPATNL